METFYAETRSDWRKWLEANHLSAREIFLVFYKKHTKTASVPFGESIEEAICFGWIDSSKRRLDDDRYVLRFSPRKPGSNWTPQNIQRAESMIEAGLMSPQGERVFEEGTKE